MWWRCFDIDAVNKLQILQLLVVIICRLFIWIVFFTSSIFSSLTDIDMSLIFFVDQLWLLEEVLSRRWKSIENMLHTLHATYIRHDLYADFSLRLERSLREFFSQQIHSSRWTRFLAAQISTVYFLSMSCRRFVSDIHAYHSWFLL